MSHDLDAAFDAFIAPKSDQLNADDLIGQDRRVFIQRVVVKPGKEQPASVYLMDEPRPWKPCKTVGKLLKAVWGPPSKWPGQEAILYHDPTVMWAGKEVGGIRVRAVTGIDKPVTVSLSVSKQAKRAFTLLPLQPSAKPTLAQVLESNGLTMADLDAYLVKMEKRPTSERTPEEMQQLADYYHKQPSKLPVRSS